MDRLLGDAVVGEWCARWGRETVKKALRRVLEAHREGLPGRARAPGRKEILMAAEAELVRGERPSLRRVINGTGVIVHTHLGRAPLAEEALAALSLAGGYSNLEFDLTTGGRGSRHLHCAVLLTELTGGEDALVVNNNAAAVALVVNEFAAGREVIVSRGELVEIGGSFRIPEMIERSGARLVEVGTTNRTRPEDYRRAIGAGTGLLLKVHPSNYRVTGFTRDVSLEELVALGREQGIPAAYDLGSGLLRPELLGPLSGEPSVADALRVGVDVVTWSGDKLLGGPQAGLILGRREAVDRLRRNPLLRALRVDKLTIATLEATLRAYRDADRARQGVPVVRMILEPRESVESRARAALAGWSGPAGTEVSVEPMEAVVGGGSCPDLALDSAGWVIRGPDPVGIEERCRAASPPLVGRVENDAFLIDFRTILPGEEADVRNIVQQAVHG